MLFASDGLRSFDEMDSRNADTRGPEQEAEKNFVGTSAEISEDVLEESSEKSKFMHFASMALTVTDVSKAQSKLDEIVEGISTAYFEYYITEDEQASGTIRVLNTQLDELLGNVKSQFHCTVVHEVRNVINDTHDLTEKINAAYLTVDSLQTAISKSSDTKEINLLNAQLQQVLDEIYGYESSVEKSRYDLEYATVYYSIAEEKAEIYAASASASSSTSGFALDMLKVLAIILPTAVLSAFVTLHTFKRKKQQF